MTLLQSPPNLRRWPALAPVGRSWRATVASKLFRRAIGRMQIRVQYPDGRTLGAGDTGSPLMVLHRPDQFASRLGADGLIGFGESYLAGDWDSDELAEFLGVLCREIASLVPTSFQRLRKAYAAHRPPGDDNSVTNARANVSHHYDLSNDLFAAFLDETMSYSAALFGDDVVDRGDHVVATPPGSASWSTLAASQRRKIDRLLDAASVGNGTRLLEIGTGWGELAIQAAARGATVTTVTLSAEQQALAVERVAAAGCSDRVSVRLADYRQVGGEYDAIVSVEMLEAVGHRYWSTYFATLDALLAPGGAAAIQAITMPHDRMLATRDSHTWITKYVFPGGCLPSVEAISTAVERDTSLSIVDRLSLGSHYSHTLRLWDERFVDSDLAAIGFDDVFARMWHFYLCYSRAGFIAEYLDVQQITLARR